MPRTGSCGGPLQPVPRSQRSRGHLGPETCTRHRTSDLRRPRHTVAVASILFPLAGCTGSGDPPGGREATAGDQTPVVQPTGAGVSGDTPNQAPDDTDPGADLYRIDPATGGTALILSSTRGLHEPQRSPDGSQLVYQSMTPLGTPQIFVFDHERRRQLTHLPDGAVDPTWSPDGSSFAFAARSRANEGARIDTDIFVMDADGGHVRRLVGTPGWDRRPDWSPDGSHVVFDTFGEIWVASIHDGELTRLISRADITLRHGPAADPTWSPDGRRIAITHSRLEPSTGGSPTPTCGSCVRMAPGNDPSIHRRGTGSTSWTRAGRLTGARSPSPTSRAASASSTCRRGQSPISPHPTSPA